MENEELFKKIDHLGKDDSKKATLSLSLGEKEFKKFGGFHLFFYITLFINLVVLLILFLSMITILFIDEPENNVFSSNQIYFYIIQSSLTVILLINIIDNFRTKKHSNLVKIIKFLEYLFALSFISYIIILFDVIEGETFDAFRSVIYYTIWMNYFKKSKRIEIYYHPEIYN